MENWEKKLEEKLSYYGRFYPVGTEEKAGKIIEYIESLISQAVQEAKEEQFTKKELECIKSRLEDFVVSKGKNPLTSLYFESEVLDKIKSKLNDKQ